MEIEAAILSWPEQLAWSPVVANQARLLPADKFVVCGMGASPLAAGLMKVVNPYLDLLIHRDYDLPKLPDYFLGAARVVCISYSGQTAETLSTFEAAAKQGLNTAVIATGGELLERAKTGARPYVQIPTAVQPRLAIGYILKALAALLGQTVTASVEPTAWRPAGEALAGRLTGKIPLLYAAAPRWWLAYTWKIKMNETAKVPAFANVLPELNHNEMEGFSDSVQNRQFYALYLCDARDDARVAKRFEALAKLNEARGLAGEVVDSPTSGNGNDWSGVINSLILADWTTLALARARQLDPAAVPTIEQFKKLMG